VFGVANLLLSLFELDSHPQERLARGLFFLSNVIGQQLESAARRGAGEEEGRRVSEATHKIVRSAFSKCIKPLVTKK
jgi:hypothetical protein